MSSNVDAVVVGLDAVVVVSDEDVAAGVVTSRLDAVVAGLVTGAGAGGLVGAGAGGLVDEGTGGGVGSVAFLQTFGSHAPARQGRLPFVSSVKLGSLLAIPQAASKESPCIPIIHDILDPQPRPLDVTSANTAGVHVSGHPQSKSHAMAEGANNSKKYKSRELQNGNMFLLLCEIMKISNSTFLLF